LLKAKPPPTSQFDLEAIEAYEQMLDLSQSDFELVENDLDTDDDDDDDDDVENSNVISLVVPSELHDKRVDAVLAALLPDLSRSSCGALVDDGCVFLVREESNAPAAPEEEEDSILRGRTTTREPIQRKSFKVAAGQELCVDLSTRRAASSAAAATIVPQNLPLNVLYEDAHMIVINKAPNMVVHPGAGNWDGTVVNALAYYLANTSPHGAGEFVTNPSPSSSTTTTPPPRDAAGEIAATRPGIVHRLDKGTTGVLVVAKTAEALASLSAAFANRKVRKTYLAVCVGNPGGSDQNVVIDKPIGRHPVHRQRMRVVPEVHRDSAAAAAGTSRAGRRAVSIVNTLAFDGKLSVVRVRILTGRTHQIRVHLQDHRTPVYGDDVYGSADWNQLLKKSHQMTRPLLHAYKLEVEHPVTGKPLSFTAPMPPDMAEIAQLVYPNGRHEHPELFVEA
jgi:23S rRNA pseudouridine1911/1915/1917 synthase